MTDTTIAAAYLNATVPFAPVWTVALADHVTAAAWSPDGTAIAAASAGGDTLIVDAATGQVTGQTAAHPLGVLDIAWSPDSRRLAVGGQDGRLSIHDRATGGETHIELDGWVAAVAWSPNGRHLAAAAGATVVTVDLEGTVTHSYDPHPSTVTSLAWEPKGRRVATGFYGGVAWYEPGRPEHRAADSHKWKGSVLAVAVSSDGRWLAAGNQDRSVQIWRIGKTTHLEMPGYPAKIDQLAFDPTGRYLAVGSVGFTTVWDCAGKGPEGSTPCLLEGHPRRVAALAWGHHRPVLVTGDASGLLAYWTPATDARPVGVVDVGVAVTAARWHPSDTGIAVATATGELHCLPPLA